MQGIEIIAKLEELSPVAYAMEWDNSGLQVGDVQKEVQRVLVAVDVTKETIQEAIDVGADMIISHHPLLFHKMNQISAQNFVGKRIIQLIENGIVCYSMHTNFDVLGMADAIADEINLLSRSVLEVTYEDDISKEGIGRYGHISENKTLRDLTEEVKKTFQLENVKVYGDLGRLIGNVAISGGSGKSMVSYALKANCDVLISGDLDYHTALDACAQNLCLIDAGHFGLEKIFLPYMKDYLKRELPQIEVHLSKQKEIGVVI